MRRLLEINLDLGDRQAGSICIEPASQMLLVSQWVRLQGLDAQAVYSRIELLADNTNQLRELLSSELSAQPASASPDEGPASGPVDYA